MYKGGQLAFAVYWTSRSRGSVHSPWNSKCELRESPAKKSQDCWLACQLTYHVPNSCSLTAHTSISGGGECTANTLWMLKKKEKHNCSACNNTLANSYIHSSTSELWWQSATAKTTSNCAPIKVQCTTDSDQQRNRSFERSIDTSSAYSIHLLLHWRYTIRTHKDLPADTNVISQDNAIIKRSIDPLSAFKLVISTHSCR